jgi:regulation of enolase protein 1 (concanavalin A-like superfamily)
VSTRVVAWDQGTWTHAPASVEVDGDDLVVTAVEGSDAWRATSYGFVHDSEHALTAPLEGDRAVEVCFTADLTQQFDQAGVFLRASSEQWVKAGVEYADGVPQLGVVVTDGRSDWSAAPAPSWAGRRVTVRASRSGDAVTIRARVDDEPWVFVRLLPLDPGVRLEAGPFVCAPTRAGLTVRFHSWTTTDPDGSLH